MPIVQFSEPRSLITTIRPYNVARDEAWLLDLWHDSLSPCWSIGAADLGKRVGPGSVALVAERDRRPVAFALANENQSSVAGLLLMLVDSGYRRQGIASQLLRSLELQFRSRGITELVLGYGPEGEYFWPGVPVLEQAAWPFFRQHGWKRQENSSDLVLNLAMYQTPTWVKGRLVESGATIDLAHPGLSDRVMEFERLHFPKWAAFFQGPADGTSSQDVLVALAPNGAVVGTVLLDAEQPITWSKSLGQRCGALSVLGVSNDQQGRGIGLALAARAAELLKAQGCSGCYIGWTGLIDWYGKLGAEVWNEYRMSRKQIA